MVLSKDDEKELLLMKEEQKAKDRAFQMDFLREEHKLKMERLSKMHLMVKDGWKDEGRNV